VSDSEARQRVVDHYRQVKAALLRERDASGHWTGELSTSALSTATAVMALEMVRRGGRAAAAGERRQATDSATPGPPRFPASRDDLTQLIDRGVAWIEAHQNPDGGWGDTIRSFSNISTTMLCHAVFYATGTAGKFAAIVERARAFIENAGGIPALRARYGKDRTFAIPILTHCALAELVDWHEVAPLPFELACIPASLYKWARLPVVSYALPALIAIGQARHHFVKPFNPLTRLARRLARARSLAILDSIQPASGGFLEAAPLTSFVTMSLAGMGMVDHPVTRRGVEFLTRSVRPDGSWPIDSNLATWVTTLSINALGAELPADAVAPLRDWLLGQQYREVHPYTNADPGGWAWTDLSGGVPDADDTAGAILALIELERRGRLSLPVPGAPAAGTLAGAPPADGSATSENQSASFFNAAVSKALARGVAWLLDLQNRDGGWPTFCRGWGTLPFDRSAPDLTAHAIRALVAFQRHVLERRNDATADESVNALPKAVQRGLQFLSRTQRADGSWLPLWFGNQHLRNDENPTYGTARVLAAYRDTGRLEETGCRRGIAWLRNAQNPDGGWGGAPGIISSIEETALALEVLLSTEPAGGVPSAAAANGLSWLLDQIDNGKLMEPSPIGFYFARLWYFEKLYPLIHTVAALRRAAGRSGGASGAEATIDTD
jgi:squalene-hopene/tetraprenyl-beta-curcumene cyclase